MIEIKNILYLLQDKNVVLEIKTKKQDYFMKGTRDKYTKYTTEKHQFNYKNKDNKYDYIKLKNNKIITYDDILKLRVEKFYYNEDLNVYIILIREYIKSANQIIWGGNMEKVYIIRYEDFDDYKR